EDTLTVKLKQGMSNCYPYLADDAVGILYFGDGPDTEPLSVCTGSETLGYSLDSTLELLGLVGGKPLTTGRVLLPVLDAAGFATYRHGNDRIAVVYPPLKGKKLKGDGWVLDLVAEAPNDDTPY